MKVNFLSSKSFIHHGNWLNLYFGFTYFVGRIENLKYFVMLELTTFVIQHQSQNRMKSNQSFLNLPIRIHISTVEQLHIQVFCSYQEPSKSLSSVCQCVHYIQTQPKFSQVSKNKKSSSSSLRMIQLWSFHQCHYSQTQANKELLRWMEHIRQVLVFSWTRKSWFSLSQEASCFVKMLKTVHFSFW